MISTMEHGTMNDGWRQRNDVTASDNNNVNGENV